ncbi:MAG TPA: hypothetical protein VKA70_12020 [Blastocatellia bacterium]|nr:hypothetical protein [Blastocatellia bacterium]
MKNRIINSIISIVGVALLSIVSAAQDAGPGKPPEAVAAFGDRVKQYVKLREKIEEGMPNLSKEAKPEEIDAHKKAFQEKVRAARVGAKPGDIFTADIVGHIRATLKREFKGKDLKDLRETVLEAENKGVPVRVNYPYPVTKELVEMPPTLLLALPELPKQMRYRYVGNRLLLVDRENGLIVDYMVDALP